MLPHRFFISHVASSVFGPGSSRAFMAYTRGAIVASGLSTISEAALCEVPAASVLTGLLPLWATGANLSICGGAVKTLLYGQSRR